MNRIEPKIYLLLCCIVLAFCLNSVSASQIQKVELPTSIIHKATKCFLHDSDGYIWMGSVGATIKYDGYTFEIIEHKDQLGNAFRIGYVNGFLEDKQGNIWIASNHGIFIYNKQTKSTTSFLLQNNRSFECKVLLMLKSGEIAIGTKTGLYFYNPKTNETVEFDRSQLSHSELVTIYEEESGIIWAGTIDKLNRIDREKNTVQHLTVGDRSSAKKHNLILSIQEINNGKHLGILVGTETGLFVIDRKLQDQKQIYPNRFQTEQTSNEVVKSICKVTENELWLGTDYGFSILNLDNQETITVFNEIGQSKILCHNVVHCVFKDRKGNIWLGTDNGVDKVDPDAGKLNPTLSFDKSLRFASIQFVNKVVSDRSGNLWIATDEGLYRYNSKTEEVDRYVSPHILHSKVNDILVDISNNLWVVSSGGLNVLYADDMKKSLGKNAFQKVLADEFSSGYLLNLTEDRQGNIWVGTYDLGLIKVSRRAGRNFNIMSFKSDVNDESSLPSNYITSVCCDKDGYLWVGTGVGICRFDPFKNTVDRLKNFTTERRLGKNHIFGVNCGNDGWVWYNSYGSGLCGINYTQKKLERISAVPDQPINVIPDERNLWITTFTDLYRYNRDAELLEQVPRSETSITAFNGGANSLVSNRIYFGGQNGFVAFNPDLLEIEHRKEELKLTSFSLFEEEILAKQKINGRVLLKHRLNETNALELRYNENIFKIGFSTFNFKLPENDTYLYKLEGYDEKWIETRVGDNFASYIKVPYGNYTFKVRTSGGINEADVVERSVQIKILPPPWLTIHAKMAYVLVVILLVWTIWYYSLKRIKQKNEMRFERMKREKSEELYQLKSNFFTNVSHELKTPLTLIYSPIDKLLENETDPTKRQALSIVRRNSLRMKRIVNQLMDVRKMELGKEALNLEQYDLVLLCKSVYEQFQEQATHKNIDYQFVATKDRVLCRVDFEKLEKVVYNLLSNAFKFTPNDGLIQLKLGETTLESESSNVAEKYISITVRDSGAGIQRKEQDLIFEPFYTSAKTGHSSNEGTGIGLALVKEYSEMHKGFVEVESKPNNGSSFCVFLPQLKVDEGADLVLEEQDEEKESEANINDKQKNTKPHILIVEDNRDLQDFMRLSLAEEFSLSFADNGKQGLLMVQKRNPDLIVTDIMMPVMDGLEFCKALKSNTKTSHIPIIVLTAKGGDVNKLLGVEIGIDDYVEKPFNLSLLRMRIVKLIEERNRLKKLFLNSLNATPQDITTNENDEQFMTQILEVIEKNLDNPDLNVTKLSDLMGVSNSYLYRKVKGLTGQSVTEFIRVVRLKTAAKLLKKETYNVNEVMLLVGFSHHSYFSKCFKELYGVAPKDFK